MLWIDDFAIGPGLVPTFFVTICGWLAGFTTVAPAEEVDERMPRARKTISKSVILLPPRCLRALDLT
jgi:hypothetical protein